MINDCCVKLFCVNRFRKHIKVNLCISLLFLVIGLPYGPRYMNPFTCVFPETWFSSVNSRLPLSQPLLAYHNLIERSSSLVNTPLNVCLLWQVDCWRWARTRWRTSWSRATWRWRRASPTPATSRTTAHPLSWGPRASDLLRYTALLVVNKALYHINFISRNKYYTVDSRLTELLLTEPPGSEFEVWIWEFLLYIWGL